MAGTKYPIGIDGCGTTTRAMLAGETGRVLGTGQAASANRNHYRQDGQERQNLRDALRACCLPHGPLHVFWA